MNQKNITIELKPTEIQYLVVDIRKLQKYSEKFDYCLPPYNSTKTIINNLIKQAFPNEDLL